MSPFRLFLSVLFLTLATALGLEWVFHSGAISVSQIFDAWRTVRLPVSTALAIAALSVGIYFLDAFRYRAFGDAFCVKLPLAKSLRASAACFLFSWISPYGMLGPPAAAYLFNQQGSSWEEALLISYGKSLTGSVFLLVIASCLIALGYLPGGVSARSSLFLLACLGFYLLLLCTPPFRARLRVLVKAGFAALGRIGLSHLIYFSAWIAICLLWAISLGAPFRIETAAISCLFVALLYMSPTPSGAGVAELTAIPFFGKMLGPGNALLLVFLFRASTYGVQILSGTAYFMIRGGHGILGSLKPGTQAS